MDSQESSALGLYHVAVRFLAFSTAILSWQSNCWQRRMSRDASELLLGTLPTRCTWRCRPFLFREIEWARYPTLHSQFGCNRYAKLLFSRHHPVHWSLSHVLVAWILVYTAYREQRKVPPPRQNRRSTEHQGENTHLADLSSANEQSDNRSRRSSSRAASRRVRNPGAVDGDEEEGAVSSGSEIEPRKLGAHYKLVLVELNEL